MDKKKEVKPEVNQRWTPELEQLLAEWAEKASCFRWLHSRSEKSYRIKNYSFTIPVIILSTLTGTANFAMDTFVPQEKKKLAMAAVGSVNIFAGILSTLQNFLRYAELMESHRLSEVSWSKFGRDIEIELAIDPNRRKPALDFLKICRAEYDRLIEQSPLIDDVVIKQFKCIFKGADLRKPDICNGLHRCKVYELSEEEKMANIMAKASEKMIKPVKKWTVKTNKSMNPREESKREIDELKNMSRVSMFREKTIGEIKKVIKPISELVTLPEPEPEPESEPEPEPEAETEPEIEVIVDETADFLSGIKDE